MLNSDPDGDLFFAIPQIGFSNGKLSVGLEVGVGVPGVLSASVTGGVGGGGGYWSIQGSAAGLYAGYGSSGAFAGFGYQYAGFSGGVSFGAGGPSIGIGYGGGFGNGYAGSLGISYGKGGFGYSAGVSSTYMWGTIDPGISAQGDGALAQGNPGDDVGNQGLYENETEAYNVMVEQTQNSGVENAAWLTTEGVLLSPYKTSVYTNTPTGSSNSYYKLDIRGKRLFAINNANGREYRVTGQAHTHPSVNIGLSKADRKLSRSIGGMPVYSIGPRLTHRGHFNSRGDYFMNFYTNTSNLLNGKVGLLGQ